VLSEEVLVKGTKVLGVCLGMQLLMQRSEEGKLNGLGWILGESVRFKFNNAEGTLKIPHMGWNTLQVNRSSVLFQGLDVSARFYFVHSYHVVCAHQEDVLATAEHGYHFVAAVERGNIMGVQFHPEKSHRFGMIVLKNFIEQDP
jgi:glutamine amidotransferase